MNSKSLKSRSDPTPEQEKGPTSPAVKVYEAIKKEKSSATCFLWSTFSSKTSRATNILSLFTFRKTLLKTFHSENNVFN